MFVFAPLASASLTGNEGQAQFSAWLLGGNAELEVGARGGLSLAVGAGAAALVARMVGSPSSGFSGQADSVHSILAFAHAAARIELSPSLSVQLQPLLGWSSPEVRVKFGEREAARFGQPIFVANVGIQGALVALEKL